MSYTGLGQSMSAAGSGAYVYGSRGETRPDNETLQQMWGYLVLMSLDPSIPIKQRAPYGAEFGLVRRIDSSLWRATDLAVSLALAGWSVLVPFGFGMSAGVQYLVAVPDSVSPLVTGVNPQVALYGEEDTLAVLIDPSVVHTMFPDVGWVYAPPVSPAPAVPSGLVGVQAPLQLPDLSKLIAAWQAATAQPPPAPPPAQAPAPAPVPEPGSNQLGLVVLAGAAVVGLALLFAIARKR